MTFSTFEAPFSAQSPWNTSIINPIFNEAITLPPSYYYPSIGPGAYSTRAFLAMPCTTQVPVNIINAAPVKFSAWNDHFAGASGSDGQAALVDVDAGIIHDFWQLKNFNGKWSAMQHSICSLTGLGWPTHADPTQGTRAIGVPSIAGLIRADEINDGDTMYRHALALSLPAASLAKTSIIPMPGLFTAHDNDVRSNTGAIPYGALLMLPSTFDSSNFCPALQKIAKTLQTYGARVVDRNVGTPFYIYVENGSGFDLMPKGWDNQVAFSLQKIRSSLRMAIGFDKKIDGNGQVIS